MKNTGVILEKRPSDWVFGDNSLLKGTVINLLGDYRSFLPTHEKQIAVYFDSMACVTFSALNCIEIILNYKRSKGELPQAMINEFKEYGYIDENDKFNFSDRYIAKLSGTTRQGNSLSNVADAIRNYGLVPEKLWPFPTDQRTPVFPWDEFYKEIPQNVIDVGQKVFLKWVKVNTEYVLSGAVDTNYIAQTIERKLKEGPLQIATATCPGWNEGDVVPIKSCTEPIAHATTIINHDDSGVYNDYDHYVPYQKMLAPDYPIPWAMLYALTIKPPTSELVKEVGSPAVYLHVMPDDEYYAIADSEVLTGGQLLKTFSGSYGNAAIKSVPAGSIPQLKKVGDVKPRKF
jgi:hypothetical protein